MTQVRAELRRLVEGGRSHHANTVHPNAVLH